MTTFAVPERAPAQGADVRHHARPDHAGDLHRARRHAAVAVLVHVPALRPAADLHGRAAVPAPRRGPRRREQRRRAHGRGGCCRSPTSTTAASSSPGSTAGGWSRRCSSCSIAIGGIDLLFALDSIPAVFGVTEEPFIVFAANAFALLGLRALFFLVKGLLDRLVYLSTGLALILAFIGVEADPALGARRHQPRRAGDLHAGHPRGDPRGAGRGHGREPGEDAQGPHGSHAHAGSITGHKPAEQAEPQEKRQMP